MFVLGGCVLISVVDRRCLLFVVDCCRPLCVVCWWLFVIRCFLCCLLYVLICRYVLFVGLVFFVRCCLLLYVIVCVSYFLFVVCCLSFPPLVRCHVLLFDGSRWSLVWFVACVLCLFVVVVLCCCMLLDVVDQCLMFVGACCVVVLRVPFDVCCLLMLVACWSLSCVVCGVLLFGVSLSLIVVR